MKKIIITAILILSSLQFVYSQSGWFWQNPLPTGNDIRRIKYVSSGIAYAVGNYGTVIKTFNGGLNWFNLYSIVTSNNLTGLYFINPNTGIVVGHKSSIYKTINGGVSWINCSLVDTADFENVVMFNATTGVAISSARNRAGVFKTTDGGSTWNKNPIPSNYHLLEDIVLLDSNIACIIGNYDQYPLNDYHYILRTTDKGTTWDEVFISEELDLLNVYAINSHTIYSLGREYISSTYIYSIVKSTDAGLNWSFETNNINELGYFNLHKIAFKNSETGYCVGDRGRIIKTTNSGLNWSSIQLQDSMNTIYGVDTYGSDKVMVGGEYGLLYLSTNSGLDYTRAYETITTENITDVSFINSNTGIVVCDGGSIFKTENAGYGWTRQYIDTTANLTCCKLVDENTGYIAGTGRIYKTTNGGLNWIKSLSTGSSAWQDLDAPNPNVCIVVGTTCKSVRAITTNGGVNWDVSSGGLCGGPLGSDYTWYTGVSMPGNNIICAIGGHTYQHVGGVPLVNFSSDGGQSWNRIYLGTLYSPGIRTVDFSDTLNGIFSGGYRARYKTTNGGLNWINYCQDSNYCISVNPVRFATPDILYGRGGKMKSTDGGINWFNILFITEYINNMECVDQNVIISVGDRGKIVRTDIGGLTGGVNISNIEPSSFKLHQNYPNPFNPSTKIRFDLPKSTQAKLIIYDILGREVTTLVNEKLNAGSYIVDWPAPTGNGSSYPSGVYFYRLITMPDGRQAKDYSQTKRMVLIK